jgi:hypothetical protein
MTFTEEIKKLKDLTDTISMDISTVLPSTRPAWEMKINQAKLQVDEVRKEIVTNLQKHAGYGIFLSGQKDAVSDFLAMAEKMGDALSISVDDLYLQVANKVEAQMGTTRQINMSMATLIAEEYVDTVKRLGLQLPWPTVFNLVNVVVCPTFTDVLKVAGHVLNAAYIHDAIAQQAIKMGYGQNVVPVVLLDSTPEDRADLNGQLFSGRNQSVTLKGQATKKQVVSAFSKIKANLGGETESEEEQTDSSESSDMSQAQ